MNNVKYKENTKEEPWTPLSPRMGTVKDLAKYLRCSVGNIYNLVWKGELVANKSSGLRFRGEDVQNFIDERDINR